MRAPRRLLAYALVPLSAVPFALTAPLVAPSVEKRVQQLRDRPAVTAPAPRPVAQPAPTLRGER